MTITSHLNSFHQINIEEMQLKERLKILKITFQQGLATYDPAYLLRKQNRIVRQAEYTLNLLLNSCLNPKLSAWAYLFGIFNFNKYPLLPQGTQLILHAKPGKRATWAFRDKQGWYIGPAINHYQCITCYVPKRHRERITNTAKIIPRHISLPQVSYEDHIFRAADDTVHLLSHK